MEAADLALRNLTYAAFARDGSAPRAADLAEEAGMPERVLRAGWRRLHDAHALVLGPDGELLMAHPFSAVPTPFEVEAAGRRWFANCAWDAFGVCAALGADGDLATTCPDCGEPIAVAVRDGRPDDRTLLFHCLVPAARWWEDIAFT